jgi:CSLREA domain-containing protein
MRHSYIKLTIWIVTFFGFALALQHFAYAVTFMVNSTADRVDNNPGDSQCDTGQSTPQGESECTLRAAIQETNALAGPDTILLPAGIFQLTIAGPNENAAATGDLDILDNLTIIGAGRERTFIDGGGRDRVFDIVSPASSTPPNGAIDVIIAHVTVRNGTASGGGGIRYSSHLTIINSIISDNQSTFTGGGLGSTNLIFDDPRLTLVDSTVTRNKAPFFGGSGGGIDASFSTSLTIKRSVISANNAADGGGGIDAGGVTEPPSFVEVTVSGNFAGPGIFGIGGGISGTCMIITRSSIFGNISSRNSGGVQNTGNCGATISNTIISNNSSGTVGGGIGNSGTLALTDVKVVNNQAAQDAGGVFQFGSGSSTTTSNTIITNNSPNNCGGMFTC